MIPADEPGARPKAARGRFLKLALGLSISAIFIYSTFSAVPFGKVAAALGDARPQWIAAALGCILLAYILKIYRWTLMLRSLGANIAIRQAAVPFLGGIAFNNVLPFRAGDVIRVVAFQRFTGIAPSGQLGSLVLERLLDLLVLMIFLFVTVSFWRITGIDEPVLHAARLTAFALVTAIILFIAAPRPIRMVVRWIERGLPRLQRVGEVFLRLSDAISTLSRPLFLLRVSAVSILAWLAEGGAFYMVGQALNVSASPEAALLAVSIGTLSTIIPSSPGYVGTFHYFTAKVATVFGAGAVGATAYAILIHALLWLSTTTTGFLLLALSGYGARRWPVRAAATE